MRETCATFSDLSRDANGWFIESGTTSANSLRHELKVSKLEESSRNHQGLCQIIFDTNWAIE